MPTTEPGGDPGGRHLTIFLPSLAGGGVGRVMLLLGGGFVEHGHRVDLVVCDKAGPYLDNVHPGIRLVELERGSSWLSRLDVLRADAAGLGSLLRPILLPLAAPKTLPYLGSLAGYLERERPDALYAAKTHANLLALWARRLAGSATAIIVTEHTHLSRQIQGPRGRKWRWRFIVPAIRRAYPWADAITAVSDGVAQDLSAATGIPRERMTTIYNPVVPPALPTRTMAPLGHPWFESGSPPVLLGVGRLSAQKDFPTLLRAFAGVRRVRRARLIILGEGKKPAYRAELLALAQELGVEEDVQLPGFAENPYAYMARASVFVMSSAWEGLPSVLVEALACGCPVVSTDCPSGPREILQGGRYGRLVPVGDAEALAEAILATLDAPPGRDTLRARGAEFSVDASTQRYLGVVSTPERRR